MVYAYDNWVQLPTRDLYDTQVMAMAINAAKDMYEKGQQEMKDFRKEYGDFMTPIAADQAWYDQNVTGKIRDTINALYAQGIDPLRNAQGRAMISQAINNMDYGSIAKLKMSSENAREYLKNKAALEAQGKYSADLEERFLGYNLAGWDTVKNGAWNRVSPTQMKSLKELTEQLYNSRTARDLTEEDLKAAGIPYDSRYQYSGYLDSDILNTAKGFTPGWNDSVYSEYYRDLARRQLIRSGIKDPTAAQVETVLQRNIADANQEWLINPTKHADQFAVTEQQFQNSLELQKNNQAFQKAMQEDSQQFQIDMARQAAKDKLDQIRARYGGNTSNGGKGDTNSSNYSLTESIHHDMLFQGLRNSGIPIIELTTDKNGNVVPKLDKDGKPMYKNPDRATWEELEYAANHVNGGYVWSQQQFFKEKSKQLSPQKMEQAMKNRYGARITGIQAAAMLKRQPQKDGGFIISSKEAQLLRGTRGITADAIGSTYKMTISDRLDEIYNKINKTITEANLNSAEIKFNISDTGNNAMQISERYNHGRLETYVNGSVTIVGKDQNGKEITKVVSTNAWFPLGLNSENVAGNTSRLPNVSLSGANQSAYSSIDANYLKQIGQQQKANIGLFANSALPSMFDVNNMNIDDYLEYLELNQ